MPRIFKQWPLPVTLNYCLSAVSLVTWSCQFSTADQTVASSLSFLFILSWIRYSTDLALAKLSNDSAHTVDSTYSFNLSAAFTQDVRDPALSSPGLFPFPPGHTAQPHLPASACSEVGLRDQMLTRGKWQLMGDPSKLGHFSLRHSGFSTRSPSLFAEDPAEDSKTLGDGTARWCKDPRCLNSCREVSPPGPH